MAISFDTNLLTSYYQARYGGTGASNTSALLGKKYAPTAPWSIINTKVDEQISEAVKSAMLGKKLVDESSAKLDLPGASADYRKLFALYQGLSTLNGVAERMNGKNLTSIEKSRIQQVFTKGLAEVTAYADSAEFDQIRLNRGELMTVAKTKIGALVAKDEYLGGVALLKGDSSTVVPAFSGDVKFTMSIKRVNVTHNVAIDLNDMGATPRTLTNVLAHINGKLAADGLETRFASQRIPGEPRTITVGGKPVTMPATQDSWALKVKVDSGETVTFGAPSTAGSVYVAQSVGDPNPDGKTTTNDGVTQRQLLKFQTDTAGVPTPPQDDGANWVDGRAWAEDLAKSVQNVRATTVGPDGAVYVLADVDAAVSGQEIKGAKDVALMKYDSAGKLLYTRTLGAADQASGMALAVSADGKIAIAGSVTGGLEGATDGPLNSGATGSFATNSDSFVTLFDADGQEVWTQRRGARQADEATNLAFAADGTVYVAGRSKSTMPGTTAIGDWDGYIEAFKADVTGKVSTVFTQAFGSTGADKPAGLVVDGTSLVVASNENGRAVLRRFDVSTATPSLTATRDLGDLQGGDLTGLGIDAGQVVVAGTTMNGALSAGTITRALSGGTDAFAARLDASLGASGADRLAYYGGTGDDKATSVAVAGGQVWIAGSAGTDLPGQPAVGKKDGFLTRLDLDTGAIDWSRRFTGKEGYAAPSAIAIDTQGSTVLDRLGLPKGTLDFTDSAQVSAFSSVRTGDQFQVLSGSGAKKTITIETGETFTTLATKLKRALGFNAKVETVTVEGVRRLQIKPMNDRSTIELFEGKTGKDALSLLGLTEGIIRNTITEDGKTLPSDRKAMMFGLGLPTDLNLKDAEQVNHTLAELTAAMNQVRAAYKHLQTASTPQAVLDAQKAAAAASGGKVPTYLTNQIANYQAALNRLGGG
ncbi:hypothetical protein M9M90_12150 [Phenylobacterium sp. LH3H17]|uniref:hypothetical protein n=1 Tax=Phenylobacterium sp. LH3H17 TaxID=2903901 RepID=UPI0020C982CF|nr:hypothetical protein [Phenylobacterium sp. LH3H17]UTP37988.1 hypothetical protein M9M90_12150 [Phenylobacterium sp. LH3H17]